MTPLLPRLRAECFGLGALKSVEYGVLAPRSSGKENQQCETFHRNPAGNQSRAAEPGQQPEASLAWGEVTLTAKRRQRDQTLCD